MIKQAIIPLAGLGTRLLPLTSVFAKELLPINGNHSLEYILDECIDAGIKEIIFIISNIKMIIKKYFNNDKFYKELIKKKNDSRVLVEYKKILKYRKMIKFVDTPPFNIFFVYIHTCHHRSFILFMGINHRLRAILFNYKIIRQQH